MWHIFLTLASRTLQRIPDLIACVNVELRTLATSCKGARKEDPLPETILILDISTWESFISIEASELRKKALIHLT